jgi:hypothetical protein
VLCLILLAGHQWGSALFRIVLLKIALCGYAQEKGKLFPPQQIGKGDLIMVMH